MIEIEKNYNLKAKKPQIILSSIINSFNITTRFLYRKV